MDLKRQWIVLAQEARQVMETAGAGIFDQPLQATIFYSSI
jgi:hypothetical protein